MQLHPQAQIIVAHTLSNNGSDQAQFAPLLDGIKANLGGNPDEVSADAGYCSAANLRTLSRRRIKGYITTGRKKHGSKTARLRLWISICLGDEARRTRSQRSTAWAGQLSWL